MNNSSLSVIIPAKNEESGLRTVLPKVMEVVPDAEVLVVDDGSTDKTSEVAEALGAKVLRHPYSMGNGAAIKSGARHASGHLLLFMDADGQHDPSDIPRLIAKFDEHYEMVVGARSSETQASRHRLIANNIYNWLATAMTGYPIDDLTSGFRAARARHFRKFLYLLPNGFSYPTTSTMAFFRSGLPVAYVPISARSRQGKSHIRLFRDGARFLLIIVKIGSLFSPMRLFLPVGASLFAVGVAYYGYTYFSMGRFTNMSALLLISALLTFLIGIISEQISALHYRGTEDDHRRTKR